MQTLGPLSCLRAGIMDKPLICEFVAEQAVHDPRYSFISQDQRNFVLRSVIFEPYLDWLINSCEVWCCFEGKTLVGVISWQAAKETVKVKLGHWISSAFNSLFSIGLSETLQLLAFIEEFTSWVNRSSPKNSLNLVQLYISESSDQQNEIFSMLLQKIIDRANSTLQPIWIWQSKPHNTGILRHFGFSQTEHKQLQFPNAPQMFTMTRPPEAGFGCIGDQLRFSPSNWKLIFQFFNFAQLLSFRLVSRHCSQL